MSFNFLIRMLRLKPNFSVKKANNTRLTEAPLMPNRTEQLYNWLNSHLPENEEHRARLENVAGDASFRRYFRVKDAQNKDFYQIFVLELDLEQLTEN